MAPFPRLFSCGDNIILMHHGQKGGGRPSNVEDLIEETNMLRRKAPARSCLAFHPSRKDVAAFGSDDGSVEIFRLPHYVRLATLKTFQKLIQVTFHI